MDTPRYLTFPTSEERESEKKNRKITVLTYLRRYEHYFEKDVGLQHVAGIGSGHRHEWENAVVVVKDGEGFPRLVAASVHDGYIRRMPRKQVRRVRFQGMNMSFSPCYSFLPFSFPCLGWSI